MAIFANAARAKYNFDGAGKKLVSTNEHISTDLGDVPAGVDPAQWYANPYAEYDYRHSPAQQFLEGLGFRSGYDAFKESMSINAREHQADLIEKAHNERYDSAIEQAARERAAGINPDLAGNVDAGSSSGMEPDPNAPVAPSADDFTPFAQFGNVIFDGVKMAIGLAESGFGLMNAATDIAGKKIQNDSNFLETALQAMLSVTSAEDMDNFLTSDGTVVAANYLPSLTQVFGARRAKKYVGAVNKAAQGLKGHQMEANMRNLFAGDWISYHNKTAGGENAGFSMFADTMKVLRQELSGDFWKNLRESTKLENYKIQDQTEYEKMRLSDGDTQPTNIAGVEAYNEGRLLGFEADSTYGEWMLKKQQYEMSQSAARVVAHLNDLADNGNWFAGLAAMAIQFLFSRVSGGFGVSKIFK